MNANKKFTRRSKGSNIEKIRGPATRRTSPRGLKSTVSKTLPRGKSPKNTPSRSAYDPLHRVVGSLNKKKQGKVGEVYTVQTKFIDPETKKERKFCVVTDYKDRVGISKIHSIKHLDENGRNADKRLVEINQNYQGLTKRTGVDRKIYRKNRFSQKDLTVSPQNGFNEIMDFKLSGNDRAKVLEHCGIINKKRRG